MAMGLGFQGDIWFWEETSYGSGESAVTMLISDKVLDVRIDSGDIYKTLRGISEPSVCAFISQPSDPVIHIEWVLQPNTHSSLSTYCCDRDTSEDLKSLAFLVGANTKGATKSYYYLTGCKAKNWNISASRGNEYICTADLSVKSVATYSALATLLGSGYTLPETIGTNYAQFNLAAHTITITGKTDVAFITDSIDVTVENNLNDYWDCDSQSKATAIPGAKDVTGSCDISLDDGGAVHWGDVFGGNTLTSIAVVTGLAGIGDTFTLNTGRFDNTSVDINASGEGMLTSQPFTFKDLTIT
jgi:hypothetical protein